MKIFRESKSKSFRIPPILNLVQNTLPPKNENCQRVQLQEFQNTPYSELGTESLPPKNENCQRVQIQEFQNTPYSELGTEYRKLSESPNPKVAEYPPPK